MVSTDQGPTGNASGLGWLRQGREDLAAAMRSLLSAKRFAVMATLTLALGIGASTAIFSVLDAVLLRNLPYGEPRRLVIVTSDMVVRKRVDFPLALGDIATMREQATLLSGIAAVFTYDMPTIDADGESQITHYANVTPNIFSVFGVQMATGSGFTDASGARRMGSRTAPGSVTLMSPQEAILSFGYWQRQYGGNPRIVGQLIAVGGGRARVVGVAPRGFALLLPPRFKVTRIPDVYLAARVDWATASHFEVAYRVVARMKPGVTMEAAQAQMNVISLDLNREFPVKAAAGTRFRIVPLREEFVAPARPAILTLMGSATLVFLIACANVANLLLIRTSLREREFAVRAALGATRARLVRHVLWEASSVAGMAAVAGLGCAELAARVLIAIGPRDLPTIGPVNLNTTVLGFTMVAGLLATAALGALPAIRASHANVAGVLRSSGRSSDVGPSHGLRHGVVIAEVALAFVLLVAAGLLVRSFSALARANPGFDPAGLLTFEARNERARSPAAQAAFLDDMQERLGAMPGVTGVTATSAVPFAAPGGLARWGTAAALGNPASFQEADIASVLPGYFSVMRTRLIAGRVFSEADNSAASTSIVIDRVLAAEAFPGMSAVGKTLYVSYRSARPERFEVIGVVDQERRYSPNADGPGQMFFTNGESGGFAVGDWVVRMSGDPARLEPTVRAIAAQIDPRVPVVKMKPVSAYWAEARAPTRFALVLFGVFSGIALVLAVVGLYGVLATEVRQRTAEIGVRMAFGASTAAIFREVIGDGMRLSALGLGLGLFAALALTRAMRSLLVGVAPSDPSTYLAIALGFLAVAAIACWLPASRAAALDPAAALRNE
jgi:putative ABC transport system permease protein